MIASITNVGRKLLHYIVLTDKVAGLNVSNVKPVLEKEEDCVEYKADISVDTL